MSARPCVFIGSSSEGHDYALAIQQNLDRVAECIVWSQGVFGVGQGTLISLVKILPKIDFAVLLATGDDLLFSRGETQVAPRDNVLLEAGLFLGSLGPDRTFVVIDRSEKAKLPSDLAGVTVATFEPPGVGTVQSALGAACTDINVAINQAGARSSLDRIELGCSWYGGVRGSGIQIKVTNLTGQDLPPYDVLLAHPDIGEWRMFNSDYNGVLLDGQYRFHRCLIPSMCEQANSDKLTFGRPFDPIQISPVSNIFERNLCAPEFPLDEYVFRLQMTNSDRVLLESTHIGKAFAQVVRESAGSNDPRGDAQRKLTKACLNHPCSP